VPAAAVHANVYGSTPPKPAPTSRAGWPIFTNELSPASATSGLAAGVVAPLGEVVPVTLTVPETGLAIEPFWTAWPPTVDTAIEGPAALTVVAARVIAASPAATCRTSRRPTNRTRICVLLLDGAAPSAPNATTKGGSRPVWSEE